MDHELFQKNLELLRKTQPSLALQVSQTKLENLHFSKSKQGEDNLYEELGNKKQFFHSQYNIEKEASRWFSEIDLREVDVLYVYGIGLGHYYSAAREWLEANPARYLVFIEDQIEVIHAFLQTKLATDLLQNFQVQIHYLESFYRSEEMFRWLSWFFVLLPIEVSALTFYQQKRSEKYRHIRLKLMHDSVRKNSLASEFMRFSRGFFRNFFCNLLTLHRSYHGNKLFGRFENVPAIICGAGPSLDQNIDYLKTLKQNALIFAGGSSLNALNARQMKPHFGAGVDPNPMQYQRLASNQSFETPFFYRGRMFHDAFCMVHGPRLYLNGTGGYFISEWFEKELGIEGQIIDEGHNVVNMCVEIANALGCNPIIFVGMDLSYTNMRSYAGGVVDDNQVDKNKIVNDSGLNQSSFMRKDIYGKDVYTLWKWVNEADWIGDYARQHPQKTFINATQGGIGFPGVENIDLKKLHERYFSRSQDLEARVHMEIQNAHFDELSQERILELIDKMRTSLLSCIEICDGLFEELDVMKKKVEQRKKVESNLQTGKAALFEIELSEELAFEYILSTMSIACGKIMERQCYQVQFDKSLNSDIQRNLKRLEINRKKVDFLKQASLMTLRALEKSVQEKRGTYIYER